MRRFTIPSADLAASEIVIADDTFHHMVHVLRIREGTEVVIADGRGAERPGVVGPVGQDAVTVHFTGTYAPPPPVIPAITLYQGLPKGEKIEFILQKCTELGVTAIVPFVAARSIRKIRPDRTPELVERWRKIAGEAARQSGSRIPEVRLAAGMKEVLEECAPDSLKLLLWEDERVVTLRETVEQLPVQDRVEVIIGPEGGITPAEADEARRHGFVPVSLGSNILRTETAGLVITSILQYLWGNLGGRRNAARLAE
jgi:16S rRNA (uracil1498-N3)-methyltransferase